MRVDAVLIDAPTSVKQILLALDNRLTAGENLSPEGTSGYVLTSNGPNVAPSYQDLELAVETVLRKHGLIP